VQIGSSYELEWRLEGDRLELELDHVRHEVVHRSSNTFDHGLESDALVGWFFVSGWGVLRTPWPAQTVLV